MILEFLLAALLAAFASAILCPVIMSVGVWDNPDANRKTHRLPTPTSGGLAAASAFFIGLAALAFWPWSAWAQDASGDGFMAAALTSMTAFAALGLGLWDDVVPLGPRVKFGLMTGMSLFVALFIARAEFFPLAGPYRVELGVALGVAGSALWVFTLANTVNFMDGANGLSMGSMAVGLCGLGAIAIAHDAPQAAALSLSCAGALIGLLVWNFPKGQVFAGDAGALFVGFLAAAASLIVVQEAGVSPIVPALLFFPLLADVLLTLAYRARLKRPLMEGHREHMFQIGIRGGLKHWQVSLIYWAITLHCAIVAFLVSFSARLAPPSVFAPQPGDVPTSFVVMAHAAGWIVSGSPILALLIFAAVAVRVHGKIRRFAEARGIATP